MRDKITTIGDLSLIVIWVIGALVSTLIHIPDWTLTWNVVFVPSIVWLGFSRFILGKVGRDG